MSKTLPPLSADDLAYYLLHCADCGAGLTVKASNKGQCCVCNGLFSPNQRRYAKADSGTYSTIITLLNGQTASVIARADKLLDGKIHAIYGLLAVTSHGIECLDRYFAIHHSALCERDWLTYLSKKRWLNKDDFALAMKAAKSLHAINLTCEA